MEALILIAVKRERMIKKEKNLKIRFMHPGSETFS
jgi:hypothetical protein